ncbi:MAG: helicase-related protein [Eubacteriales bacterium]|nr:helicase-related protein [Eubacteriales bacterium]
MNQRELYQALGANNEEDLLRHFPSRYEDLHVTPIPAAPKDKERYVFKGKITSLKAITPRGTSIIRFKVSLFGGEPLSCVLFNQPFYLSKLSVGKEMLFVAYYSLARNAFVIHSLHDLDSYYVMTGLRPVYTLPKGVSPSYFTSVLRKLLSYPKEASYIVSPLPPRLVEKYRLINEYDAFRCVHLPRDEKDLYQGLRVFKYEEALSYCIRSLSLKKQADERKRSPYSIDHNLINKFVKNLPYKLTHDQLLSIKEIVLDLESDTVMFRLLQGDVGTGKTIVAFVALYANWLRKKQGVLMAPTYELALQHYNNALKVFASYPIKIGFLAGASQGKKKALEAIQKGEVDILIATHAAFSSDVVFDDLGLSIIDEQQLFGVEQREELLAKGKGTDVLMMSATPIPRTLSQIINGDVRVSTLNEFPHGKRNVRTLRITSKDPLLHKAVEKALAAKRQVFIVAPKISDAEKGPSSAESVYQDMEEHYPGKCLLLHGRIKKEEQEKTINAFTSGEKPILVSTTVIQVGIDVSSAALLIVYDANYFGLSTLHQLRGRIGRSGEFALALLVYDGEEKDAIEKLDTLVHSDDGLKISEFDLRQRGSGSYGGTNQSGKSELKVANFVSDLNVFQTAREDAKEILANPGDRDNAAYLHSLDLDKEINLA